MDGSGEREAIEGALSNLRPGLQADGFELRLESLTAEGEAVICLEAGPNACLDCLVPDAVLVQILESGIRQQTDEVSKVSLVKQGFDELPAH